MRPFLAKRLPEAQTVRRRQFGVRSLIPPMATIAIALAFGWEGCVWLGLIVWLVYARSFGAGTRLAVPSVVFGALWLTGAGYSTQIRPLTGELRECFLGVPLRGWPLGSNTNAIVSSLLDDDTKRSFGGWRTVVRGPDGNGVKYMLSGYYERAAVWAEVDPVIAGAIVHDLVRYAGGSFARATAYPPGRVMFIRLLYDPVMTWDGDTWHVSANWRGQRAVQLYLQQIVAEGRVRGGQ